MRIHPRKYRGTTWTTSCAIIHLGKSHPSHFRCCIVVVAAQCINVWSWYLTTKAADIAEAHIIGEYDYDVWLCAAGGGAHDCFGEGELLWAGHQHHRLTLLLLAPRSPAKNNLGGDDHRSVASSKLGN